MEQGYAPQAQCEFQEAEIMKSGLLFLALVLGIAVLLGMGYSLLDASYARSSELNAHLVEQPIVPTIYIVNESAVFEKDGYLYYEVQ